MKADTMYDEPIKPGYKRTEAGVIPEDWEALPFGNFINSTQNGYGRRPKPGETGPIVLRLADVTKGFIDLSDGRSVEMQPAELEKYRIEKDDLLFIRVNGSRDYVGQCICVENDYEDIAYNDHLIRVRLKRGLDSRFVCYSFGSQQIRSRLLAAIPIALGGQLTINQTSLENTILLVPSEAEQHAIAEALLDVDTLLDALDRLISKKRNIKQGTMQALLTGRVRLPGFERQPGYKRTEVGVIPEDWDVKVVGELGATYGGLSGKSKADFQDGQFPYIPFLNIMKHPVIDVDDFDYVNIKPGEKQNKAVKEDLFFNGSSETPEEVGMCSVLLDSIPNLYLNSFCFGFRLNQETKANSLYLSYFFRSSIGRELLYSLAQGATRYNLSKSNFLQLAIPYPSPNEQTAIAEVLSDMDAEIEALEKRRAKLRDIKQGMMQELLTGKTRLVQPQKQAQEVNA